LNLAKYRNLFLEESRDHLKELGGALLALEKDPAAGAAIDLAFRMAHSIKGMAGSLGYDAITEIAHRLEDRMETARAAGRVDPGAGLALLFRGLEGLERMVEIVATTGQGPAPDPELARALSAEAPAGAAGELPEPEEPLPPPAARVEPAPQPAAASPTVRVRTETLDRFLSSVGEVILTSRQVRTVADHEGLAPRAAMGFDRMDRVVGELQRRALSLRTAPLLRVMEPLPRLAREIARHTGKRCEVELRGAELELDRSILDRLGDPLVHLVRNAVDHGLEPPDTRRDRGKPETGRLVVDARREKDSIRISVSDDGAGIDLDAVRARAIAAGLVHADLAEDLPPTQVAALVFRPGLSTKQDVSDISGRGVGMDAVKATIEALGGRAELESRPGLGTTTSLVVPITAAVQRVLLLGVREETVAVPISKVERIVEVPAASIEQAGREAFALIDEEPVLVLDLARRLGLEPLPTEGVAWLVIAEVRGERVALRVGRLAGQQEIYVKPVPRLLAVSRALAGLTVLGDGSPVFALDVNQLL
jgi:chemotaxis protein histidine kinase CheA